MNVRFKKYLKRVAWGVAIVGFGAIVVNNVANGATAVVPPHTAPSALAAPAPLAKDSVTGPGQVKDGTLYGADLAPGMVSWFTTVWDNTVTSVGVKDGSLQLADFSPAAIAGLKGAKGDTGATGAAGASAIVSVSAATSLTNRPDSGTAGTWALDTLSRNFTITKHSAVDADKCGAAATECYLYYASGTDTGTFATVDGWKSPGAGVVGAGNMTGTVSGAIKGQFYATSATPDPSLVDATVDGAAHPTARWAAMFFPSSVTVTDIDLRDWGWTYNTSICNKWVNAKAGNSGDITGVNAC